MATATAAPEAPQKRVQKAHNAEIGDTVLWYNCADTKATPAPAMVVETDGRGVLNLAVFVPHSLNVNPLPGVRHVDTDWVKEHPEVVQRIGGWDYKR